MIAVLKFGGQCEVIQNFTNDYMPVKDSLGNDLLGKKSMGIMNAQEIGKSEIEEIV